MADILDVDLRDFSAAYHAWVDRAQECEDTITQWYRQAHDGRDPALGDLHHAYWRVMVERERWGTLRNALQDTWPLDVSNGPAPLAPPAPPSSPKPHRGGDVLRQVVQVTNERDGEFLPRMYSYWPNAVIRGEVIYVFAGHADGEPRFFQITPDGRVARLGPLLPYRGTSEGWYWDADGWVYLIDGPRLRRVNPFSREDRVVFSIERTHPDCELWQAHSSDDGETHSATVQRIVSDGPYPRVGTVVCRGRDLQTFYEPKGELDESQITPDGEFLIIKEDEQNRIVNLCSGAQRMIWDAEGAVGHSDCGPGILVGEFSHGQYGECVLWDLRGPLAFDQRRVLFTTWNMGHVSIRGGVCLLSDATHLSLVSLNGGGVVSFLRHGMTVADPLKPYNYQVKANLDPSGRVGCYMSNQGGARFDVFLTPIPE